MHIRSILAPLTILLSIVTSAFYSPANAVVIEITYPDQDIVRAALSEIDAVDDRVYTLRFDANGTAEILFGDGLQGARPSSGGNVVASYQFGAGNDGNIINEYEVTETLLPFIPIEDFWPAGAGRTEASLVIIGLTSLKFDFALDGLRVIEAELAVAPVPVPAAIWLFATALLGLLGIARRQGLQITNMIVRRCSFTPRYPFVSKSDFSH